MNICEPQTAVYILLLTIIKLSTKEKLKYLTVRCCERVYVSHVTSKCSIVLVTTVGFLLARLFSIALRLRIRFSFSFGEV